MNERSVESRLRAHAEALEAELSERPLIPAVPDPSARPSWAMRLSAVAAVVIVAGAAVGLVVHSGRDGAGGQASSASSAPVATMWGEPLFESSLPPTGPVVWVPGMPVAIGDLVMRGAADALAQRGFVLVDAVESRQFAGLSAALDARTVDGRVPDIVVIDLASNAAIAPAQLDEAMDSLAGAWRVVLLTSMAPAPWVESNNTLLREAAAEHDNVVLLDWAELGPACPGECFAADGFHLTSAGADYYATLVAAVTGVSREDDAAGGPTMISWPSGPCPEGSDVPADTVLSDTAQQVYSFPVPCDTFAASDDLDLAEAQEQARIVEVFEQAQQQFEQAQQQAESSLPR